MASYYRKGKSFTVVYRLKGCPRQFIHGIKSEPLARRAKEKKSLEEQLTRADLLRPDPHADGVAAAGSRPLADHVADFERDIVARGSGRQHARQQAAHCRRLFRLARIARVAQIALEPVQRALGGLRGPRQGARTCNAARQAAVQFERYLLRTNKVRRTVLQNLARFNEPEDVRRKRRPLTEEEVEWLLATTAAGRDRTSRRCGIPPADRAMLYATGIGTGFRRRGLLGLERSAFFVDPNAGRRFVRLAARLNKNGLDRDQPVPTDLADRLHEWLAGKPAAGPVWRPRPHADLALWFRRDMEAARVAWIAAAADAADRVRRERSDALKYVYHDGVRNVYADFHGLRHTGITFVVRRAGLRVGQEWADHSTPALTARYAAVDEADMAKGMAGLPALGPAVTRDGAGPGACPAEGASGR